MSEVLSQPYSSVPMLGILFHVSSPNSMSSCSSWPFYQEDSKITWRQTERPLFVMPQETHRLSESHSNGLCSQRNDHLYVLPHSYFPHRAEMQILIVKYKYFPSFPVQYPLLIWHSCLCSVSHWFKYRLRAGPRKVACGYYLPCPNQSTS